MNVERKAMLIYSMGVSVDGYIADREGMFGWTVPDDEQFRFHLDQVRGLGSYLCGRRLYEAAQAIELVDELRILHHPIVIGSGTPFLPPVKDDIRLDLVETRTFGSRVIYERYARARVG